MREKTVDKNKILIIGASGNLGQSLYSHLKTEHEVTGTYYNNPLAGLRRLDIRDGPSTAQIIRDCRPDIIMVAGGLTDVDLCEKNRELAFSVNVLGIKNITENFNGKTIYFSTDFVFDGEKGNYLEDDATGPLNHYGITKSQAEKTILESGDNIVARVAVLYGGPIRKGKFTDYCIMKLSEGKTVNAITDHIRSPTFIPDLPPAVDALIEKNHSGIIHACGPETLSAYDMAKTIQERIGKGKVNPVASKDYSQTAQRPKKSSLNTSKLKSLGIRIRPFSEGIKTIL
jgi:dTDP-4-dehydrorhamnose reductase